MSTSDFSPEIYQAPGYRLKGPMLYVAPVIGIFTSVLLTVILVFDLFTKSWVYPALFIVWFGLGFGFYELRKRSIERERGQSFESLMKEDLDNLVRSSLEAAEEE